MPRPSHPQTSPSEEVGVEVARTPDGRTELRISDPRVLRALAHAGRQRVITELYAGEVLTATDLARVVGLSPSAMSYHLRALERWGIVTRGDASPDGRERPWRAAADSISLLPQAHAAAGAADSARSVHEWSADLGAGLDRLVAGVSSGDEGGMTSRSRLWLTPDEERDLRDRLHDVVRQHRGRTRTDHPDGARPFDVYTLVLPAEPPSGEGVPGVAISQARRSDPSQPGERPSATG